MSKKMVKTELVCVKRNKKYVVYTCNGKYFIRVGKNDFVNAVFLLKEGYRIRG